MMSAPGSHPAKQLLELTGNMELVPYFGLNGHYFLGKIDDLSQEHISLNL